MQLYSNQSYEGVSVEDLSHSLKRFESEVTQQKMILNKQKNIIFQFLHQFGIEDVT